MQRCIMTFGMMQETTTQPTPDQHCYEVIVQGFLLCRPPQLPQAEAYMQEMLDLGLGPPSPRCARLLHRALQGGSKGGRGRSSGKDGNARAAAWQQKFDAAAVAAEEAAAEGQGRQGAHDAAEGGTSSADTTAVAAGFFVL
jgi:hypothetical protein